jgi:hypothetical protein
MRKSRAIRTGLAAVLAAACGLGPAKADEAPPQPATVRVEVQMVSVAVADAPGLIATLKDDRTAAEAFARVQEMLAQGRAELLGWPILWLRSSPTPGLESRTGLSESSEEIQYPVHPEQPPEDEAQWGAPTPTSIQTRNAGIRVEVGAAVPEDGRTISIDLVSSCVRLLGFDEHRVQRSALGIEGRIQRPSFWSSRTETSLNVAPGRPTLIGVVKVHTPEPRFELFILRARATTEPRGADVPVPAPSPK